MIREYFKVVRTDYTSFHDRKFKWPVKGVVEIKDATVGETCGPGLHLGVSVSKSLQYAGFPFRILRVRPLGPILSRDDTKIRVAKAESLGEIPVPKWASDLGSRIKMLPKEMKVIPWLRGTDSVRASKLIRRHFELLVPFGFKFDFKIEIVSDFNEAIMAWDADWGAAWDAARAATRAAAWDVAWVATRDAAWNAARAAAIAATRDAAWGAAWDASGIKKPNPFKPLWECWKLGVWPIGFNGNIFKIYVASNHRTTRSAMSFKNAHPEPIVERSERIQKESRI